ncbi:MAG: immunoglobulin domain-containing protein [Proteobacteria bacterium]|nr:immunoglobulin domain-containing protein [Pseudomonadota bacterium]
MYYTVAPNITAPGDGDIFAVNVTNDSTVTCTAFALPPPTIEFFYNGMILNRTDDETGIGDEIPMRVQVGQTLNPILIDNGSYEVSRTLTLFNVRDERLTGFQCRAMNSIVELSLMPSDTAAFEFLVQGNHQF